MNTHQPSLWDNLALENGYRCLIDLNFKEAISQFKEASQFPIGDPAPIFKALEVCEYWKDRVQFSSNVNGSEQQTRKQYIADFLNGYIHYSFSSKMSGFKKALLGYLVDQILKEKQPEMHWLETTFDLLLELKSYQNAETLAFHYLKNYPEKHYLHYFLAQAQWMNANKDKARSNYASALLYCPDSSFISRIEGSKLKKLVTSFGSEMALAYGRLYGILPYVSMNPEFQSYLNEKHHSASQIYSLLVKTQQTQQNNCREEKILYRKQLKELDPDFFEVYFRLLKKR